MWFVWDFNIAALSPEKGFGKQDIWTDVHRCDRLGGGHGGEDN